MAERRSGYGEITVETATDFLTFDDIPRQFVGGNVLSTIDVSGYVNQGTPLTTDFSVAVPAFTTFSLDSLNSNAFGVTRKDNRIVVADSSGRLFFYSRGGTYIVTESFNTSNGNDSPRDVYFDPIDRRFYVLDRGDDAVYVYNEFGVYIIHWALNINNAFPSGVTRHKNWILAMDQARDSVFFYDLNGVSVQPTEFVTNYQNPTAVTSADGYIWVLQRNTNEAVITAYNDDGTTTNTPAEISYAPFSQAEGVAFWNNTFLLVQNGGPGTFAFIDYFAITASIADPTQIVSINPAIVPNDEIDADLTLTAHQPSVGDIATTLPIRIGNVPVWATVPDITATIGDMIGVNLNNYVSGAVTITAIGQPAGVMLNNGILSGTVTAVATFTITATAMNAYGSAQTTFDVTVESTTVTRLYGIDDYRDILRIWDIVDGVSDISLELGDWTGGVQVGNYYYILDNSSNSLLVWDINNRRQDTSFIYLGRSDWTSVFFHNNHFYVIDNTANNLRVYDTNHDRQYSMDISLDSGDWAGGVGHMNNILVLNRANNNFQGWDTDGNRQVGIDFSLGTGDWTAAFGFDGNPNFAPSWVSIPSIYVSSNTNLNYDVSGFASGSPTITFSLGSGAPSWASITSGGTLTGIPTMSGNVVVPIVASNTEGTASSDLTLQVDSAATFFLVDDQPTAVLRTRSSRDISLGTGNWLGGFAYNNHFYLMEDNSNQLRVWDSAGTRQSGMDISLGSGVWRGGFAYNNHFYLVEDNSNQLRVWDSAGTRQSGMDISLGTGSWLGGFAYNNHFYLVEDNSNQLRVWDSAGNRQSGMDISLGTGNWLGGFAYNNHFYLMEDNSNQLRVWDSAGTRQSGMDISLGTGSWLGGFAYNNHFYLVETDNDTLRRIDPLLPSIVLGSGVWQGGFAYNNHFYLVEDTSDALRVWDSAGTRQSGMDISLGTGSWLGGFAYNNHFYLMEDNSNQLRVWDSAGTRQSGMDISLGSGVWRGGFAYNNHFYLVEDTSDALRVWDSAGTRQSGMDISLGTGSWLGGFAYNNHFYLVEDNSNQLRVWDSAGNRQSGMDISLGTGNWQGGFLLAA